MTRIAFALMIIATGLGPALADKYADVAQFAQSICGDIPEGSLTRTSIQGKVEANASVIAKIISGDADVSGSKTQEIYRGIPFDKLPDKIPNVSMCKLELVKILGNQNSSTQNAPGGIIQNGPGSQGTVNNFNFGATRQEVPKIDVINTTYPGNEGVIRTLEINDGKTIYLDKINMDLATEENHAVMKSCFRDGHSKKSVALERGYLNHIQLPIPKSDFKTSNDCYFFLELDSDDRRPYKLSSGGTGIVNYLVRKNFLVNMQIIGVQRIFDLREVPSK